MRLSVGDTVWVVCHPRKGFLQAPVEDTIAEVCEELKGHPPRYLLTECNSMGEEGDQHWTNDYYGNLVTEGDFYLSCEEAHEALVNHYWHERSKAEKNLSDVIQILYDLRDARKG